jgi:hypothetical protein
MKLGRIGHWILVGLAAATGVAGEVLTAPGNAFAHFAWAPLVGAAAKLFHFELGKLGGDGKG